MQTIVIFWSKCSCVCNLWNVVMKNVELLDSALSPSRPSALFWSVFSTHLNTAMSEMGGIYFKRFEILNIVEGIQDLIVPFISKSTTDHSLIRPKLSNIIGDKIETWTPSIANYGFFLDNQLIHDKSWSKLPSCVTGWGGWYIWCKIIFDHMVKMICKIWNGLAGPTIL